METIETAKKRLPILDNKLELDVEAELKKFEEEQMAALGLEPGREHWRDDNPTKFTAQQRVHTTILCGGLTQAHDLFVSSGLRGLGYKVQPLDVPDNAALSFGKEFGNRGQCNPTYFTVGNLIKYLTYLRDEKKIPTKDIVDNYLFVTAGACGPCRFGTYVTEYRKALRDSGFDGFRVLLFQQQGGLKQATGDAAGLEMNPKFFVKVLTSIVAGDVLNALAYRIRPFEVEKGATDAAMAASKKLIAAALEENRSVLWALVQSRRLMSRVEVDRSRVKPKVSVIGEFWAMTTEGDGNYGLQRFLESEGAEVEIQLVTAWILFMIWEQSWDTRQRMVLKHEDKARKGLVGVDVRKKLLLLTVAKGAIHAWFQLYANLIGLHGYHLPNMDEVADTARDYYNNHLRGGEGHMEVGKLILNVKKKKATMTLSVKPFGCMPSSGVSDGVQSMVTEKFPGSIFCAIETNGDGAVNVYSRVQMMLFKARQAAEAEFKRALEETGLTREQLTARLSSTRYAWSLWYPRHSVGATAANTVYEVAGQVKHHGPSLRERVVGRVRSLVATARTAPARVPAFVRESAPAFVERVTRLAAF